MSRSVWILMGDSRCHQGSTVIHDRNSEGIISGSCTLGRQCPAERGESGRCEAQDHQEMLAPSRGPGPGVQIALVVWLPWKPPAEISLFALCLRYLVSCCLVACSLVTARTPTPCALKGLRLVGESNLWWFAGCSLLHTVTENAGDKPSFQYWHNNHKEIGCNLLLNVNLV